MTRISRTRKTALPVGTVWPYIADFSHIHNISPVIRRTVLLSSHSCGAGAERLCEMGMGMGLTERVTEWREGESYSIEVLKVPAPVREFHATLGVRPDGNGSELFMHMTYKHRFGFLGNIMDAFITRPMMDLMVVLFLATINRRVARWQKDEVPVGLTVAKFESLSAQ